MTSLITYGTNVAASTLTTASKLVTATGGTGGTVSIAIGTATGYGELYSQGNASAWAGAGSIGTPSGNGWLYDHTTLNSQTFLAGTWTPEVKSKVSVGSFTADIYYRAYAYDTVAHTYTLIGTMLLSGQSWTTTAAFYTFGGTSLSAFSFNANQMLYVDCWLNVTANSTGSSGATIILNTSTSSTQGVANVSQLTTPGYSPNPVLSTSPTTLSFSATQGGSNPASQNDTLAETAGTATAWTSSINYGSGSGWLSISPSSGSLGANGNTTISVSCATGSLSAGTYTATITFTATSGGATATIGVTFVVNAVTPGLGTSPTALTFHAVYGGSNPASQNDTLSETNGAATAWTSAIGYGSGSGWLAISPSSGSLGAHGTQNVSYSCTSNGLAAGTYTATVTYTATTGGATATVNVTLVVAALTLYGFSSYHSDNYGSGVYGVATY